jgi:hypothetical protein
VRKIRRRASLLHRHVVRASRSRRVLPGACFGREPLSRRVLIRLQVFLLAVVDADADRLLKLLRPFGADFSRANLYKLTRRLRLAALQA